MMPGPNRRELLRMVAGLSTATMGRGAAYADPTRPRIKIGQIGVGHAHASKLSVYRNSPDYEVVGIVEPDERLRQAAKQMDPFNGLQWMSRDQLLSTPGLQAVLVETRVPDLLDNAEAAVAAGMHVHLDKPAGSSLPQYRRLLEAASRKNLWVQMGYMYRYNPGVLFLREVLGRGWLGDVFEVSATMSKVVAAPERLVMADPPGGTMFELGCHVIDLIVKLLGPPERVTSIARHSSRTKDTLIDNMLAVFEYPTAIATAKSTALEVEGFARRQLTVCGTEGTLHIQPLDQPGVRVAFSRDREKFVRGYQDIPLPKFPRYVADAADMARVIRGETRIEFTPTHDLAVQRAVLEASGLTTSK